MNRLMSALMAAWIASLGAAAGPLDTNALRNPVWTSGDNLRDPSVLKVEGGYQIFYSRLAGHWAAPSNWTIACAFTRDFTRFDDIRNVSPTGHASPGDVVQWHGRWILPYQTYPAKPTHLVFAESSDLKTWSTPKPFLKEAMDLPWNDATRVIDATLVADGDTLHCYFVGTTMKPDKANLLGHAITRDPNLQHWEILTREAPLLGRSVRAPDGVENVMVYRTGDHWTMLFSEGLRKQHLAWATSADLRSWKIGGEVAVQRQEWMAVKYGAPFVWPEGDGWVMILMGQNRQDRTTFGLLTSPDGLHWTCLPERSEDNTRKDWMRVTGEGLYGSRAWNVWGEGGVVMPNGKLGPAQVATRSTANGNGYLSAYPVSEFEKLEANPFNGVWTPYYTISDTRCTGAPRGSLCTDTFQTQQENEE